MSTLVRKFPAIARIALGLVFLMSVVMFAFQLAPPPKLDGSGMAFMGGLAAAGYFFPLMKMTELIIAVLLITGIAVPLALVMAAPVVVNVTAFHLFLAPGGLPVALFLLATELYLAWVHRDAFATLFQRRRVPREASSTGERTQLRAA